MRIPGYLGLAAALWLFSQSGWTFDRQVVVNGTHLGPTELAWLDALNYIAYRLIMEAQQARQAVVEDLKGEMKN